MLEQNYYRKIAQNFENEVSNNLKVLVQNYIAQFNKLIDTDKARDLCSEYKNNKESRPFLAPLIHESASKIAKAVWHDLINRKYDKSGLVLFLAGGPGSGKSTVSNSKNFQQSFENAIIVYDSTFSSFSSANQKIQDALSAGKKEIDIYYIYRNAKNAAYSVVTRAVKTGRTIPIEEVARLHFEAQKTIFQLCNVYRTSEDIVIHLINNDGTPELIDWFEDEQALRNIQYKDIIEVGGLAQKGAKEAYDSIYQTKENFPRAIYQAIFGNNPRV